MNQLRAVEVPGGAAFVDQLRRAWDAGDAVLPVDRRLPSAARQALMAELGVGQPVEPGDALVVATSGSSGRPKGVVLTHDAIAASAQATNATLGATAGDRWLACLPLSHVGGLSVVTRALHGGVGLTVHDRFDAGAVRAAAEAGATLTSLVPTALARIDPSIFRTILVGGSAPPAERPANVIATYGMTETGSGVVYEGVPLDGVELRVVDGEIQVRGKMLFRGYRRAADVHDPRDAAGWFATGDMGDVGDIGELGDMGDVGDIGELGKGRLRVFGRRGDLIITGGENVWPSPVEAALVDVDGVGEVAVVGRPDPEWGQAVTAVVVPADPSEPPALEALRAAARARLAPYCAPKALELVESLPRTNGGKLIRGEI